MVLRRHKTRVNVIKFIVLGKRDYVERVVVVLWWQWYRGPVAG